MNLQSWGHVSTIVGTLLLSLHLFRSNREEQDSAATWWNANPFEGAGTIVARKVLGFAGLILLILGFAISLALSVDQVALVRRSHLWFVSGITAVACLFVGVGYLVAGATYRRRRFAHFARVALGHLDESQRDKLNSRQLLDGLWSVLPNLPPAFAELLGSIHERETLGQLLADAGKLTKPWGTRSVVLHEKENGEDAKRLRNYLEGLAGRR
jgi:hypothetical protein